MTWTVQNRIQRSFQLLVAGALAGCLTLCAGLAQAQTSPRHFLETTEEHIERVVVLGRTLKAEFPNLFGGLSFRQVQEYLTHYHDAPKVYSVFQLSRYDYAFTEPLYVRLARYYGISRLVNDLSAEAQDEFDATIDELNRVEAEVKKKFFEKHQLSESQKNALLLLERAVDLSDTGIMRWQELGGEPGSTLASVYLAEANVDPTLLMLVYWIEDNYRFIIADVPAAYLAPSCGLVLLERRPAN